MTFKHLDFTTNDYVFRDKLAFVYCIQKLDCLDLIYQIRDEPMKQANIEGYVLAGSTVFSAVKKPTESLAEVIEALLKKNCLAGHLP